MRAHVVDGTSGGLRALAAGALALSAGCAMDFDPVSLLTETRVLAVEVSPLEVGPGERVRLTPRVFVPAGSTTATTATWSFCPFTAGARAGYACALPACETPLTGGADGALDADPTALALACIEKLTASGVSLSFPLACSVEVSARTSARYQVPSGSAALSGSPMASGLIDTTVPCSAPYTVYS